MASTDRRADASGALAFSLSWAGYLALGLWTIVRHNLVMGDAVSRLANASYAIEGRDPHLTAIGFVWNPIPTLAMIPLIALREVWHGLAAPGYAASIASATAMTIAVTSLYRLVTRWGLTRAARWVVVLSFAGNPLILLYATNGMSEAFLLAALIPSVGALAQWLEDPTSDSALMRLGVLLGIAYLVRYEALAATAGAALAIAGLWALTRRDQAGWHRKAMADVAVAVVPTIVAFVGFAASSWLITGSLTEQFTSSYGNTAVLADAQLPSPVDGARFALSCLLVLAPAIGPLLALLILCPAVRATCQAVATLALLAPILGAATLFQIAGSTLPFLRFFVVAIPVHVLVAAAVIAPRRERSGHPGAWPGRRLAALAATGVLGAGATFAGMVDPQIGVQEHKIASVLDPDRNRLDERDELRSFQSEQRLAEWLDDQRLAEGSVLVDVLFGFPIVVASRHPAQFVIPSDRDWSLILSDPVGSGVRYLLSVEDSGRGADDAVNRRFPGLYRGESEAAQLRLQVTNDGAGPNWRVYELVPQG